MCDAIWPLHDIVITYSVWCMANKREVEGGSYHAQTSCTTIATVWALQVGGQWNDEWLIHKSIEVNESLVKANVR